MKLTASQFQQHDINKYQKGRRCVPFYKKVSEQRSHKEEKRALFEESKRIKVTQKGNACPFGGK